MSENNLDYMTIVVSEQNKMLKQETVDYTESDGLLYCGKCHTRKQSFVKDHVDRIFIAPIACVCSVKQAKLEEEDKNRKILECRRKEKLCDVKYRLMTFENSDYDLKVARNYVKYWDTMLESNTGLLLYGKAGTGKTYMAAAIANAILDKSIEAEKQGDYLVYMNNISALINMAGDVAHGGYSECMRLLADSALVVIDDIGVERDKEFANEKVFQIIEKRMESNKPLIVTTNLDLKDDLSNPKNIHQERIYSRLLSLQPIECNGVDRRKAQTKSRRNEIRNKLGIDSYNRG